ncbi:MAG: amidohydrolase/deacetylase family metallohydrolase [Cyclobacteriaceae bacterium]
MRLIHYLLFSACLFFLSAGYCQRYDIVVKGGHVIDPKNGINGVRDVAIRDGKIVAVADRIEASGSTQIIDAKGLYVTPGLIDIHSHNFPDMRTGDPFPDGFTFRNGVTTTIDAGSSGWKSFPEFKRTIIDRSETRVLAWLNIVGEGYRGDPYEQDTRDMNPKLTAAIARRYREHIVGIKVAHFEGPEWTPVDRAVEAANLANSVPVMIDFGSSNPPLSLDELYNKHLRPGDVFTHCFGGIRNNSGGGREAIVEDGKLKPFVIAAQKKGIVFDVGFGAASFSFACAIPALKSGFYPNSISTDMNRHSFNAPMQNILNVMSLFMAMGMELKDVITATTWNSAKIIRREELGSLSPGSSADVAIFNLRNGKFGFYDRDGQRIEGNNRLECEVTIREGKVVYDLNGLARPIIIPGHPRY